MRLAILSASLALCLAANVPASAEQDMLLGADMNTPKMTQAELSRADIEAMIAGAGGKPIALVDKSLSGLDLSGLDLHGVNLRASRLNNTDLQGADLTGANLQQAWFLKANLKGAKLNGADMFGITAREADFSGADLSRAKPIGDFKGANFRGATLTDLNGGADLKNQSMGLMRTVFTGVNLDGARLRGANLGRARLDYATLKNADLTDAVLSGADASGADLTGATLTGAEVKNLDVTGTRLVALKGRDETKDWSALRNADRAITQPSN